MPGSNNINELFARLRETVLWGNSLSWWLIAILTAALLALALRSLKASLGKRLNRLAQRRGADWFRAGEILVEHTKAWFLLVVALFCGGYVCNICLEEGTLRIVSWITIVVVLTQAAIWADTLLTFAVARYVERHKDVDAAGVTMLLALSFAGRLMIWVGATLTAIAFLEINITPWVAGLGIGGVAVALAAQNILGDLFASVSIVLDKPFVLGDFIAVDDKMGEIEHIGLKTTRLRSLSGEQLIFSNTDLLKSRIHNYKRMQERRVVFTIGAAYETPYEKVAAIPGMLREIIESQRPVRFDRAHFARYADSALIFEAVYYVLTADYNKYMDVQQAVNLAILHRFAAEGIAFAYPTRTVYLHS
jgi:small-conductance mechanosensitive channel